MKELVLLGDEAVALGAIHAGISLAYGYPGTPSTEILEYLIDQESNWNYKARWCSNEKTAYESAVGASLMNKRSIITMKHVGLNVAADPFMNSVLMNIQGGLVLAVADDPGMHSSQNEQDSRWFADYAKIPCFEPRNQQEAYQMTRQAFDVSEHFHVPVMIKLVTRLSHSRAVVLPETQRTENPSKKFSNPEDFMVLPGISRKNYNEHLKLMPILESWSSDSDYNSLTFPDEGNRYPVGIITSGLGGNYYEENLPELTQKPPRLHIGLYPIPIQKIRALAKRVNRIVCIEEGYPYIERFLLGLLPDQKPISGKLDGIVPPAGELNPDNVRPAMGLKPVDSKHQKVDLDLPGRPPQLCPACPHGDSYISLNEALKDFPQSLVTSDIGCYTLGYLDPHKAIETALCMGASIPMARGAADGGMHPAIATIGDSTFMHSGLTGLADAAAANTAMTVVILDNETTAMTGGQNTVVTSSQLKKAVLGLGVDPDHVVELIPLPKRKEENTALMKKEFEYQGLSVIIAVRECVQTLKKRNLAKKAAGGTP